ncbi:hypothetical protein ABG067_000913 [Albugo candida]
MSSQQSSKRRNSNRFTNLSTAVTIDENDTISEDTPLIIGRSSELNYNSDSAIYRYDEREQAIPLHRHVYYGPGTHYNVTRASDDEDDENYLLDAPFPSYTQMATPSRQGSRTSWKGLVGKTKRVSSPPHVNRFTRRSRMRSIKKQLREPLSIQKLRVSAYCTCDQLHLFKFLKWLERIETGQLPGGEINPDGWRHKMYMGAIHSSIAPLADRRDQSSLPTEYEQKDVFYFATGCTVFWGLTRAEEQEHLRALIGFSMGPVKQVEVEDMDYVYGDSNRIVNDAITLSSNCASEKLAISFAMAQSAKLDVFEERVEETIQKTKHIPQNLATTGSIHYSQNDISKLIGRLFIERNDVNLNSDMLDEPDFFWEDDEYEPLYKKMMKYLDVDNRVHILNTRLDILRELLDVLSQQLAHQHDTKLEWIVIWLIVAEVVVQIVWNIIIKDILGFFKR